MEFKTRTAFLSVFSVLFSVTVANQKTAWANESTSYSIQLSKEISLKTAKKITDHCMMDFSDGLLPKLARQIHGDSFFEYSFEKYRNYGFTNGYRKSITPIFWGDTETSWGLNVNPRSHSIHNPEHLFISYYHQNRNSNPEIMFNFKETKKVIRAQMMNRFPSIQVKIYGRPTKNKYGVEIPNSEMISGISISNEFFDNAIINADYTYYFSNQEYVDCLKNGYLENDRR